MQQSFLLSTLLFSMQVFAHTLIQFGAIAPPQTIISPVGLSDDGGIVVGNDACMMGGGDCRDHYLWTAFNGNSQIDCYFYSVLVLCENQRKNVSLLLRKPNA